MAAIAEGADIVVNGVVGFAGLPVTLAALKAGRRLALANKESLIAGGPIVQRARQTPGAELVPVDSEHCAVHQCLRSVGRSALAPARRCAASSSPRRGRLSGAAPSSELAEVTVADALAHPTWKMGPKITVDSSTLMNKGLEVIEAHLLFGAGYDQIDVVVHPQSIVHSMVELTDGATIAQLSMPDMRLPIGYALSYPGRMTIGFRGHRLGDGRAAWSSRCPTRSPSACLPLAYEAGRQGGTAPACLNGANEVAVDGFLNGRLRWVDIPSVIEGVVARFVASEPRDLDDVLAADAEGRALATEGVGRAVAGPTVPPLPCPPGTARG